MDKPVFTGRLLVRGGRATCLLADREVTIAAPAEVLATLVRRCDGTAPLDEILADLGKRWDVAELRRLVDRLAEEGVLCDTRDLGAQWWRSIKNPRSTITQPAPETIVDLVKDAAHKAQTAAPDMDYRPVPKTPFGQLLARRSSTRTYGDEAVPSDKILALLWSAYGAGERRTVPSAGGVDPLHIDLINLRRTGDLEQGIYRIGYLDDHQVGLRRIGDADGAVFRALCEPSMLAFAQGMVVISGEFRRSAAVPLEAGHVAQNVLLAAAEAELAAVETGNFFDDRLGTVLGRGDEATPLTSIVFGAMPTSDERDRADSALDLEFHWVDLRLPFSVGVARPRGVDIEWSCGCAVAPREAHAKALAEAQERLGCVRPTGLYETRYDELAAAAEPSTIVGYDAAQYAWPDFPFVPFDPQARYRWKDGQDVASGKSVAVLADHVYFKSALQPTRPYTAANSSGVAAYVSQEGALERAVLELVERDAFTATWLGRLERPTVDPASLPQAIARRVRDLTEAGMEVTVKDHTVGLAPVLFVFAQSRALGITKVASAAAYEPEEALDKALMELEAGLAFRLAGRAPRAVAPQDVASPRDHVDLYVQRRFFRRADFLAVGTEKVALASVGKGCPKNWAGLAAALADRGRQVLWFDLTPPAAALDQGRTPLTVGRAIVPGLLPIYFGSGQEPLASFSEWSFAGQRRRRRASSAPAQPLFPHPFG
jgi:ribosomal protein S12 methylthiotransferase accessory factor